MANPVKTDSVRNVEGEILPSGLIDGVIWSVLDILVKKCNAEEEILTLRRMAQNYISSCISLPNKSRQAKHGNLRFCNW